ncbi:uncharacterized protein A4U43_C08F33270 [Asparagus officinalis]|nr:uncharacterized protein A4U43_C08F33270 [Asparagus officinalis]
MQLLKIYYVVSEEKLNSEEDSEFETSWVRNDHFYRSYLLNCLADHLEDGLHQHRQILRTRLALERERNSKFAQHKNMHLRCALSNEEEFEENTFIHFIWTGPIGTGTRKLIFFHFQLSFNRVMLNKQLIQNEIARIDGRSNNILLDINISSAKCLVSSNNIFLYTTYKLCKGITMTTTVHLDPFDTLQGHILQLSIAAQTWGGGANSLSQMPLLTTQLDSDNSTELLVLRSRIHNRVRSS